MYSIAQTIQPNGRVIFKKSLIDILVYPRVQAVQDWEIQLEIVMVIVGMTIRGNKKSIEKYPTLFNIAKVAAPLPTKDNGPLKKAKGTIIINMIVRISCDSGIILPSNALKYGPQSDEAAFKNVTASRKDTTGAVSATPLVKSLLNMLATAAKPSFILPVVKYA